MIALTDILSYLDKQKIDYQFHGRKIHVERVSSTENLSDGSLSWCGGSELKTTPVQGSFVLIVGEKFKKESVCCSLVVVSNPRLIMAKVLNEFFAPKAVPIISGIIDDSAKVGTNLNLGRFSIIGSNCLIGDNVSIGSHVVINDNTVIGNNVTVSDGTVIGSSGFGYVRDVSGSLLQFPHVGKVVIGDDVQIGSNTCIDRGGLSDTEIMSGSKISNFCQIAHNVIIGRNVVVAGKAQIGGGSLVGNDTYIGPSAVISNKITVGNNADIKLGSVIVKNVADGESVSGNFALPHKLNLIHWSKQKKYKRN